MSRLMDQRGTTAAQSCPPRWRTRASANPEGEDRPSLDAGETPLPSLRAFRPRESAHWRLRPRKGRGKRRDQLPASRLATRLKLLRNTLRPTPHVQLATEGK